MPVASGFDLGGYLERIGLSGRPSVARLHRAHVESIPFENLDPHRGVPVSLELGALYEKLVRRRRGGYCFEQNLLLAAALEALGLEVEPILARVRMGRPRGTPRPRTHLVLRVRAGEEAWLADAGFGGGTPREPIPFESGAVHEQAGWRYRIVDDGSERVLTLGDAAGGWVQLYGYVPEPAPAVDIETSNWFTCTYPRSPFVTGLNVAASRSDGRNEQLSDWGEHELVEGTGREVHLTVRTPAGATVTPVLRSEVPELLASRFGLPGFALRADGRVVIGTRTSRCGSTPDRRWRAAGSAID